MTDRVQPNGLAFSRDGRFLFVPTPAAATCRTCRHHHPLSGLGRRSRGRGPGETFATCRPASTTASASTRTTTSGPRPASESIARAPDARSASASRSARSSATSASAAKAIASTSAARPRSIRCSSTRAVRSWLVGDGGLSDFRAVAPRPDILPLTTRSLSSLCSSGARLQRLRHAYPRAPALRHSQAGGARSILRAARPPRDPEQQQRHARQRHQQMVRGCGGKEGHRLLP